MNYITTTQLRTKSSTLVNSLKKGESVSLIHRSNIIGVIEPLKNPAVHTATAEKLRAFLKAVTPKKVIPKSKRESVYRKHLAEKYGQSLS